MKKRFSKLFNSGIFKGIKWLYPGMGVKRWILLGSCGILLIIIGSFKFQAESLIVVKILSVIVVICGVILLVMSVKRMLRSIITIFLPQHEVELADIMYKQRHLGRGVRIATIGGGSGLSVLLSGLKEYTSNISAIVTVADDGGSSGRLREQFDILPPGDIRNCLVALADAPALMRDLFQFRFKKGSEFSEHSFGNLFITVMTQLTGDFEKAIKESSKVLAIRGQVIPSTLDNVVLGATYKDGSTAQGEAQIPKQHKPIGKVYLNPASATAAPDAIKAIEQADIIVLGPGSLYTSIIPNLLIKEITAALVASDAIKVYVCNAMTQHGETDGFSASEHLKVIIQHSNPKVIDYCIINNGKVPEELLERYKLEYAYPILADGNKIGAMGYKVIEDNIITTTGYVRHDSAKLARIIMGLLEEE
jgi:uncharacterized cofD-like protein